MNKKLLYFNLAVDEKDTSLGFAIDWIKHVSNEFNHVDVVSLRVNSIPEFDNSINIYDDIAIAMGNYFFTDLNGDRTIVEYSFVYKKYGYEIKVILHHSSLPYKI